LANANVLLLDEPTNHLDIPAREALEAALAEYPATLFIISHDRYLLNSLATKLLIFDGKPGGTADLFEGNYAEYVAQQQQSLQENQPPSENVQESKPVRSSQPKGKPKSKRKRKIKAQRLVGSN
jgi:ATP-binding cassette subfamily F protein 3